MMAQGRSDDSEGCNTDPQAWQGEIDSSIAHRVGFSMGNSKLAESEVGWRRFLFSFASFLDWSELRVCCVGGIDGVGRIREVCQSLSIPLIHLLILFVVSIPPCRM